MGGCGVDVRRDCGADGVGWTIGTDVGPVFLSPAAEGALDAIFSSCDFLGELLVASAAGGMAVTLPVVAVVVAVVGGVVSSSSMAGAVFEAAL